MVKTQSVGYVAERVNGFLKKLESKHGSPLMYKITKVDNNRIRLATDGYLYTTLYDPTTDETPYLLADAAQEFGVPVPKYNVWRNQERFAKMLQKYGWAFELDGGGVIIIYKDEDY